MKNVLDCIKWAKDHSYAYADQALKEFSKIVNKELEFKDNCWAQGTYSTIVEKGGSKDEQL